jgi:hypothetical protein
LFFPHIINWQCNYNVCKANNKITKQIKDILLYISKKYVYLTNAWGSKLDFLIYLRYIEFWNRTKVIGRYSYYAWWILLMLCELLLFNVVFKDNKWKLQVTNRYFAFQFHIKLCIRWDNVNASKRKKNKYICLLNRKCNIWHIWGNIWNIYRYLLNFVSDILIRQCSLNQSTPRGLTSSLVLFRGYKTLDKI